MSEYLLSTYAVEGAVPGAPTTPEEMGQFMERVSALEAEMDARGTFVFGGALHGADAAKVLRHGAAAPALSEGPMVASSEQIAGFYIIRADGPDQALAWARKVVEATNHSIEVRPFRATGRLKA